MMPNPHPRLSKLARMALAGLLAVSVAACGQDSPDKLMASAKEHLAKGERNAAVIQLKNLLAKSPDNGEARLLLGQAMFDAGDYVSAEKELARALELKQPQEKAAPLYVLSLLRQGNNKAVVSEVPKYRLFDPLAVAISQTALGDAHAQLGSETSARVAYDTAMAAIPGYPRARLGKAILTWKAGRLEEALLETDAIIAADPKLAEARSLRADILRAKGDRAGAKTAYEQAVAADNRNLPARIALIGLLTAERSFDEAQRLLDSTRRLAPGDVRVTTAGASLAFRKGDVQGARDQVQEVLKRAPGYVPALALAGSIELRDRQFAAAEANLRKAVAAAPDDVAARRLLVRTYLRMGQPAKARDALQPLLQKGAPQGPEILLLAGETYLANGDVKRAAASYQAAARTEGNERVTAKIRLGQLSLTSGKDIEGFKELEGAASLETETFQADLALITGYLQRRELDKAMKAVQELEKKQPRNPLTFQLYAIVHLSKKDLSSARKSLEKALELDPAYLPAAQTLAEVDVMQGRPEDARRRYEALIAKEPKNERLYISLAALQERGGGSSKEVLATLQAAVKADPQAPAAHLALINFNLRIGDTKAALLASQQALAALPSDARIIEAAGVAQEAAGEINQAIATYNKLASLLPQSPQPLYRLAALYQRTKDLPKALDTLQRVRKIAPDEFEEVASRAVQLYLVGGRYEDARREARSLQKAQPKSALGWSLEGDVWSAERKFADAERLYKAALRLEPNGNIVAVKLHAALSAAGKKAEADSWAKKWVADHPKDAEMLLYLGDLDLAAKDLNASAAYYRAALAIQPNNGRALNNLAWIGGQLGDPKALGYAERAVKLSPYSADTLDTYGMLLLKKGEADKALPVLERAHQMAPARNDLRLNYAKALIKAGRKDDARGELEALQAKENFAGKEEVAGLLKGL